MSSTHRQDFADLFSAAKDLRYSAFLRLADSTDQPVPWAYEIWDELVSRLQDPDNHMRAIAAQLLSKLAKSDPENCMVCDIDALFAVTRDDRFVTARHALQAFWKVGLANEAMRRAVVERLSGRFLECAAEKNSTLIRYDIIVGLQQLATASGDETIREQAQALVELETDPKYKKKYLGALKKQL